MNTPEITKRASRVGAGQLMLIALIVALGVVAGMLILRPTTLAAVDEHAHESAAQGEAGPGNAGPSKAKPGDEAAPKKIAAQGDSHDHEQPAAAKPEAIPKDVGKGAHGGKLLAQGDLRVEVLMAEANGKARLQLWLEDHGQPLSIDAAALALTLTRPDGTQEKIDFTASGGNAFQSRQPIAEPHVFDAQLTIDTGGAAQRFVFSEQEGLIALTDSQITAAGIALQAAAPAKIGSTLQLPGEIRFNEDRTAHIVPRVGGVVERVSADLGQQVKKGQVLAVLSSVALSEQRSELQAARRRLELARTTYQREKKLFDEKISPQQDVQQAQQVMREAEIAVANASQKLSTLGASASASSLGRYELRAPFDGMVVEKHLALGESVKDDANVLTISDLSTVWAELNIAAKDLPRVRVGGKVLVRATAFDAEASGTVSYVGSLIGEQTRTARARVTLRNPDLTWRPGLFVNVEVSEGEGAAAVTVAADAVQTVDGKSVVFLKVSGGFVPQPVQTGRSDGQRIEVKLGLQAGAVVATTGSFSVKAEQGKGTATHTH